MKVLFTPITSSSIAHIIRSFAVADRLKQEGHDVFFTSCTLRKDFIESRGYEVIKSYEPFNLNDPEDQSINYLSEHKKEMVGWFQAEIDAAREVNPKVVISSPGFFGPRVYFATGIPVIALMNAQYYPSSKGLMGISLASDSLKDKLLRTVLRPIFNKKFITEYLSETVDAYKQVGIDAVIKDRKDLYAPVPVLIPGDEEFEPLRYQEDGVEHVGPIFWKGFDDMETDLTAEKLKSFKGNDKLIYLTFGGSVFNREIFERMLSALAELDVKKVVGIGPNFDRSLFPEDTETMLIRNLVPGLRVSKISDVVINHGAQGAIMQALSMGKPVVAFPVGIDQSYFSNRLEELQLGININKVGLLGFSKREKYCFVDDRIPNNMVEAVKRILGCETYKRNAESFSKRMRKRYPNPVEKTVKLILEYAE